jgi:hypothetical protein
MTELRLRAGTQRPAFCLVVLNNAPAEWLVAGVLRNIPGAKSYGSEGGLASSVKPVKP